MHFRLWVQRICGATIVLSEMAKVLKVGGDASAVLNYAVYQRYTYSSRFRPSSSTMISCLSAVVVQIAMISALLYRRFPKIVIPDGIYSFILAYILLVDGAR